MQSSKNKKYFSVCVSKSFKAKHHLWLHKDKPEPAHPHHWKVEAYIDSQKLDSEGMALDFIELDKDLDLLIKPFKNSDINKIKPFDKINPTAENIASWIFDRLIKKYDTSHQKLEKVVIWEASRYSAAVSHERP